MTATATSSSSAHARAFAGERAHRCQQGAGLRQPGLAGYARQAARNVPRKTPSKIPRQAPRKSNGSSGPILTFEGDSDAHIVRGLIAILFALYSGKSARDIIATDAIALFDRIGLRENLTPQRSNGLRAMVERIRAEANAAQAAVA